VQTGFETDKAKPITIFNMKKDLHWLIQPIDATDFVNHYMESKPLILKRHNPDYYAGLLTFDEIDYLVSNMTTLGSFDVRLASAEKVIFEKQYATMNRVNNIEIKSRINSQKVRDLFHRHKATIIIEHVTNILPSVLALSKALNRDLSCSSGANIYLSPADSQGFDAHYDTHDVFILQVAGSKRWKIYSNPVELPLATQSSVAYDGSQVEPLHDVVLEQGDVAYIPRGYVHEAMTNDELSAHITLGVYSTTWTRLVLDSITKLASESEEFRSGFFVDLGKPGFCEDTKLQILKDQIAQALTIENLNSLSEKYRQDHHTYSLKEGLKERNQVEV